MANPSRDWRSEGSRGYERDPQRYRNDDQQGRREANRWRDDEDYGRSSEGIGDYGGYGEQQGAQRERSSEDYGYRGGGLSSGRSGREESQGGGRGYFGTESGPDYGRAFGSAGRSDFLGERGDFGRRDFGASSGQGRQGGFGSERQSYGSSGSGAYGYGSQAGGGRSSRDFAGAQDPWSRESYGSAGNDWQRSGSNRGKGPKGYERSDDRLKELICERLTDDADIDASEISVNVSGGVVKLTGSVESRADKYQVEELVERCGGVKEIDNQLRIQSGQGSGQSQGRLSGSASESSSSAASTGSTSGSTSTRKNN